MSTRRPDRYNSAPVAVLCERRAVPISAVIDRRFSVCFC